jgi:hypothetical protein
LLFATFITHASQREFTEIIKNHKAKINKTGQNRDTAKRPVAVGFPTLESDHYRQTFM